MRITFVSSSLSMGGAERTVANISGGLAARGHDVSIITKYQAEADTYEAAPAVHICRMPPDPNGSGPAGRLAAARARSNNLKNAILETDPEIVISFTTKMNVRTLLALRGTGLPVIISERNNPHRVPLSLRWKLLRRYAYSHAELLVSLSQGVDGAFSWIDSRKRTIVPNALPPDIFSKMSEAPEYSLDARHRWFLASGRLVHQKGFDILISAFARIHGRIPEWRVVILGQGEKLSELESLIRETGLNEKVILPGRFTNPFPIMSQASAFVLSSRFEGFGNVIIESMAMGVPVISFDCRFGPSEILEHNVSGLLVNPEDEKALSEALLRVASSAELRDSLLVAGKARAKDFEVNSVAQLWEEAAVSCLHRTRCS